MNRINGPWTESGANLDPDLIIVRGEIEDNIAAEVRLCSLVGIKIAALEVAAIEEKCWNGGQLKPGTHIDNAYPGLLKLVAGEDLDSGYYAAA
jgi:hypothetical protein